MKAREEWEGSSHISYNPVDHLLIFTHYFWLWSTRLYSCLTTWVTHFSQLSNPPNRSFLPVLLCSLPWSPPQPTLPSSWWQLCYCELFDTLNVKPGLKYFQIANILTALSGEKIKIYNFCWHCSSMERRKRRQDLQSVKYYILLIFAECPMTGDVWVRIREAGTHVAGGE